MPDLKLADATLHYEMHEGDGFPLLLFAPGFLSSRIERWSRNPSSPGPQYFADPIEAMAGKRRMIALDIRNAGASRGAIGPDYAWHTYIEDFLALIDHLGIRHCHVMGGCIGVSFAFALAKARPDLVASMVLQNPIGRFENDGALRHEFDDWANTVRTYPEVDSSRIDDVFDRMFGNDFIFSVSRDFVGSWKKPVLLLAGDDTMHPAPVSREIAERGGQVEVHYPWKGLERRDAAIARIVSFLDETDPGERHTTA